MCRSNTRELYWTVAQMVAHHASNGCNLRPGDLFGSGTISGTDPASIGCLLEMTFELDGRFETVGTATSGGAALDLAARERPDAIVFDLGIQGVDGLGVLPTLRSVLPDARIIIFTGHDDVKLEQRAMDSGASALVLKGGSLDRLLEELSAAVPADQDS